MKICLMLGLLIPLAIEDIKTGRLNLVWMIILGSIGGMYQLVFVKATVVEFLCGLTIGAGLLLIAANTDSLGTGDGIMFLAVGSICGFWECFSLLGECMMLCFAAGVVFRFFLRRSKKLRLPVAPFALAAYLLETLMTIFTESVV